jgi:ferric-dicitrate binding protein FerR (iron transport regulator)
MLVQEGKVYAKVEKKAAGFTVRTPGGTVKVIGTEFGSLCQSDRRFGGSGVSGRSAFVPG